MVRRLRRRPRLRLASWHPFPSRRTKIRPGSSDWHCILNIIPASTLSVILSVTPNVLLMDSPVVPSGTDFALLFAAGVQSSKFQFRDNAGKPCPPLPLPITIKATLGDGSLTATVTMIP